MSRRIVVGVFEHEEDVIQAARVSREHGFEIADAFTPYAVHGLDRAMGLKRSWMPWACFGLGAVGLAFATWFEFWTTAVSWPLNVGGRPWNSLPAFVPVMFELMVLFAGVGVVITFLIARRLGPFRSTPAPDIRATDDRFVLVLNTGASDPLVVRRVFDSCHALTIEEREVEDRR